MDNLKSIKQNENFPSCYDFKFDLAYKKINQIYKLIKYNSIDKGNDRYSIKFMPFSVIRTGNKLVKIDSCIIDLNYFSFDFAINIIDLNYIDQILFSSKQDLNKFIVLLQRLNFNQVNDYTLEDFNTIQYWYNFLVNKSVINVAGTTKLNDCINYDNYYQRTNNINFKSIEIKDQDFIEINKIEEKKYDINKGNLSFMDNLDSDQYYCRGILGA